MVTSHQKTHKESGFTLIELLLTAGIAGVLASIALPLFQEYRARAYDAVALSALMNIRSVIIASDMESNLPNGTWDVAYSKRPGQEAVSATHGLIDGDLLDEADTVLINNLTAVLPDLISDDNFYFRAFYSHSSSSEIKVYLAEAMHCKGMSELIDRGYPGFNPRFVKRRTRHWWQSNNAGINTLESDGILCPGDPTGN